MSRISAFIDYLHAQLGNIYVWGGQSEELTAMKDAEAWIKKRETSTKNANRAITFYRAALARTAGKVKLHAYDCSGLIMHYFQHIMKWAASDTTADGLFRQCPKDKRGSLTSLAQLQPGDLLFRDNGSKKSHVGVYVGDGMEIEAKGRDDGVVKEKVNIGYWTHWGRHPYLQTEDKPETPSGAVATPPETVPVVHVGLVTGNSINYRIGPGTSYNKLGVAHKDDMVFFMEPVNGWCAIAIPDGTKFVAGYMSAKYIKEAS